jgi:hypothetical protein
MLETLVQSLLRLATSCERAASSVAMRPFRRGSAQELGMRAGAAGATEQGHPVQQVGKLPEFPILGGLKIVGADDATGQSDQLANSGMIRPISMAWLAGASSIATSIWASSAFRRPLED